MARIEKTNKSNQQNINNNTLNLKLSGSQINLSARPTPRDGRASARSLLSPIPRRPMSAMPELSAYKTNDTTKPTSWLRPQSADTFITHSVRRSKLAAKFPVSVNRDSCEDDGHDADNATINDVNNVMSASRLALPSSQLLETLLSEPVMRSWANPEVTTPTNSSENISDDIESEKSEDPADSEVSLGTKIQNLAQKNVMELTPGVKTKPPLPNYKRNRPNVSFSSQPSHLIDDYYISDIDDFKSETKMVDIDPDDDMIYCQDSLFSKKNAKLNQITKPKDRSAEVDSNENLLHIEENHQNEKCGINEIDNKNPVPEGLSFQRWLTDDNECAEAQESEKQTDIFLENLRKQQEEFNECLAKANLSARKPNNKNINDDFGLECLVEEENENSLILEECRTGLKTLENDNFIETNEPSDKKCENIKIKCRTDSDENGCRRQESSEKASEIKADFSLDEYDAKLKQDKDFLSLIFEETMASNSETLFLSLDSKLNQFEITLKSEKSAVIVSDEKKKNTGETTDSKPSSAKRFNKRREKSVSPARSRNSPPPQILDSGRKLEKSPSLTDFTSRSSPSQAVFNNEDILSWMSVHEINSQNHENKTYSPERRNDLIFEKPERDSPSAKSKNSTNAIASAYDDIVTILQVLEEEENKSSPKQANISTENDVSKTFDDLTNFLNADGTSSTALYSASSNYKEILSFLDEVDRSCIQTLNTAKLRAHSVKNTVENVFQTGKIPKIDDLLTLSAVDLAHQVLAMHLQLEEKKSSVKLLQDTLSEQHTVAQKTTKQTEQEHRKKLKAQKDEFENVVKRHQKFIDQLIADKKTLSEQCETLVKEVRALEDRHASSIKAIEHRHSVELQRVKEMHMAAERLRREKWIEGKTQKIKEMTVKGLEPELQAMTARHQQEVSDLRSIHKREIEELEMRAARKTQQQCEALRDQLTAEKEDAIAKERELMRHRLEKLSESEEKSYQEQRRRLMVEIAKEKQRLEEEFSVRETDCLTREQNALRERDRAIEALKAEFDEKIQVMTRRHCNELKCLKENLDLENESWRTNFKKQQAQILNEKETELREQCRKERDKEIELVIDRLECEASEAKKLVEQAAENRLRRLTEKYESEIRDLEVSEETAKRKCNEMRNKLTETEDELINLKSTSKRLEQQLEQTKDELNKLNSERNKMKNIIREEFQNEVKIHENEIKRLKTERDKELQQIYTRVKVAIARKDEALTQLTREHATLQEHCTHLENLLEQQRKEYLIKHSTNSGEAGSGC